MDQPEKWYIVYGRGAASPFRSSLGSDTQWLFLLCDTEDEALNLSCRLLAEAHVVREIGRLRQDELNRTRDAAEIVGHCACRASTGTFLA